MKTRSGWISEMFHHSKFHEMTKCQVFLSEDARKETNLAIWDIVKLMRESIYKSSTLYANWILHALLKSILHQLCRTTLINDLFGFAFLPWWSKANSEMGRIDWPTEQRPKSPVWSSYSHRLFALDELNCHRLSENKTLISFRRGEDSQGFRLRYFAWYARPNWKSEKVQNHLKNCIDFRKLNETFKIFINNVT